ncbi:hypothetical protein HaLaN_03668 [Haematococcus lacustris]|uniref:Uncharacterized protein n=1 Tax=Haematococcus lacustris TaxID=44745 RepID=A0A699YR45_HAELA|nr:hypothetical protein HaLaN_03668 [Haematococcus lacustris]
MHVHGSVGRTWAHPLRQTSVKFTSDRQKAIRSAAADASSSGSCLEVRACQAARGAAAPTHWCHRPGRLAWRSPPAVQGHPAAGGANAAHTKAGKWMMPGI